MCIYKCMHVHMHVPEYDMYIYIYVYKQGGISGCPQSGPQSGTRSAHGVDLCLSTEFSCMWVPGELAWGLRGLEVHLAYPGAYLGAYHGAYNLAYTGARGDTQVTPGGSGQSPQIATLIEHRTSYIEHRTLNITEHRAANTEHLSITSDHLYWCIPWCIHWRISWCISRSIYSPI